MTEAASTKRPSTARLAVGVIGLLVIIVVTVSLGRWQLSRADQKRVLAAQIEAGRTAAPLMLSPDTPTTELVAWRKAAAQGRFLDQYTVLLDNRNIDDKPGFWVFTPFAFDAPGGQGPQAVAVLRGWMPRDLSGTTTPISVRTPEGPLRVEGELIANVPRLLELPMLSGGAPAPLAERFGKGEPPRMQNYDAAAFAEATGLTLLPMVLQQTADVDDGLLRNWPAPPVSVYTHIGYAIQWFLFATIAAVALGVLIVRRNRPAKR